MTKSKGVPLADLPAEVRKQLGGSTRKQRFSVEQERRHAIRVLATIAELSQEARARVLRRAAKLNEV